MRLTTRFRVRTLIAAVALVGLGFGIAFEAINRYQRDRLLQIQARHYRDAAIHRGRAWECSDAEVRGRPYKPAERARLLLGDGVRMMMPSRGFSSWRAEGEDHLYWGERIYSEGEGCAEQLRKVEARLLLP
jgi:hypothetical protein